MSYYIRRKAQRCSLGQSSLLWNSHVSAEQCVTSLNALPAKYGLKWSTAHSVLPSSRIRQVPNGRAEAERRRCLRAPGEPPLPLPDVPEVVEHQPYTPTEVHSVVTAPRSTSSSAEAVNTPAVPAFRGAVEMLSNPATLAQRQRDDTY